MPQAWIMALIGGCCIGLAALLLMVFNGRIAGISGIVAALLRRQSRFPLWQGAFVVGLIMSPWLVRPLGIGFAHVAQINPWLAIIGGLLVGFGTRMGSGCTSGHGICGLGRLSKRSIVATTVFVLTGMITASIVY